MKGGARRSNESCLNQMINHREGQWLRDMEARATRTFLETPESQPRNTQAQNMPVALRLSHIPIAKKS